MFQIPEFTPARVASITNRVEKHGDDEKPAVSLSLEIEADAAAAARGITPLETLLVRAYMAGALSALASHEPRADLLNQCVQYGRTVGTALEVAR